MSKALLIGFASAIISVISSPGVSLASEGKGTIGLVCIDYAGVAHLGYSAVLAEKIAFDACVHTVVLTWEEKKILAPVLSETANSCVPTADNGDSLIYGYTTYRAEIDNAVTRLKRTR